MRHISIVLFSLFFGLSGVVAQNNALGLWLMYSGNFNLRHNINVVQELHYRSNGVYGKDVNTLLYRNGIGVNLSKDNDNVLVGYTYIKQFNYDADGSKFPSYEHRTYQQYVHRKRWGIFNTQQRIRIEQRFLSNDFFMRYRLGFAVSLPVNAKKIEPKTLYIPFNNELFLINRPKAFDRHRITSGIGYMFNKNTRAELTLVHHALTKNSFNQVQVLVVNSFSLLNFHF
jgi:hypothetical protein